MNNKIRVFGVVFIIFVLILVSSCAVEDFKEIKKEENVGKTFTVAGTVESPYLIGSLSGFTLRDKNGEPLQVRATELPKRDSQASVTGVLMKDSIFGYYLKATE